LKTTMFFIVFVSFFIIGSAPASVADDIRDHPRCPTCNMDRREYAHSRMLIDYREGPVGFCSIHCAGADLAVNRHKTVKEIFAADYATKRLIPAKSAFWVIGGDRGGVMTQRAKWAFEKRADAEAFVKDHGGGPATYEDAMKATFDDMYADIKAVRKKALDRKAREKS